jgi:predicted dehydrogenase
MRFALLGNHLDGLAMAHALAAAGNILVAVCDTPIPEASPTARSYSDLEDLLADPAVEAVIVAGPLTMRFEQLRRTIQSERTTYCVYPCDEKLDRAYEAAWMQGETKHPLIPLLPDALHPAYSRLAEIVREWGGITLLKWETSNGATDGAFRGWDVLRKIGGEIIELSGVARTEDPNSTEPMLFHGKFEKGGLIQATVLPGPNSRQRIVAIGPMETLKLDGPDAAGTARLRRIPSHGSSSEENWGAWDRWTALVSEPNRVTWQDAIRSMELDDALLRSIEKRKASDLEYGDVTEDAAGKGKLTLIGCGMIWMILLVFALSIWEPWIRWAIVPMLLGFFSLLLLRWAGKAGKR